MSRASSLTADENARVVEAVRRLVASHGSQSALAAAFQRSSFTSAVSQQTISAILSGRTQAGYAFARSVAELLGISVDDLLAGRTGAALFKDLPG